MNKLKNVTMKNSGQDPEVSNLMQRLVREGTLIVYSLLALFLLIALVSYSPKDPGFTTTGTGEDVVNAVGVYGAWLADIFWYLLGYLAFAFPILLIYKVYISFRESALESDFSWPLFALKTGGFFLLVISACGLATLHFHIAEELPSAGGVIGSLVADLSIPVLATLGSTLLLLAVFLFGLTITVTISSRALID
jgi:S-DNA-T family DNA segregation ATPase FtsK/SpoIIIE